MRTDAKQLPSQIERTKTNERARGQCKERRERKGVWCFANVSVSLSLFFSIFLRVSNLPECPGALYFKPWQFGNAIIFSCGSWPVLVLVFSSLSKTHQKHQLSAKWRSFDPAKEREKMILEEYPRRRSKVLVVLQSWFLHMVLAGIHLTSGWSGLVPILLSPSLLPCFCPIVKCSPCHSSLPSLFHFFSFSVRLPTIF